MGCRVSGITPKKQLRAEMSWWSKPVTTDDLIREARAGLATDPTISTYTFIDGVEQRRPANIFAGLNTAFNAITNLFCDFGDAMHDAAQHFLDFSARLMPFPFNEWFDPEEHDDGA